MDTASFLGVEQVGEHRWALPVRPEVCSGYGLLFGGCALGAAVHAAEAAAGRPLAWATGQFISHAQPPEVVHVEVDVMQSGGRTTQVRVRGHVDDREVIGVMAALGGTDFPESGRWVEMPEVPPPDECPPRQNPHAHTTIASQLDQRLARGRSGEDAPVLPDGRSAMWTRVPRAAADVSSHRVDAAVLAVLGDFVPFGTHQALTTPVSCISLDNTLRIVELCPTEWVLLDVRVDSVARGYAHGDVHLWTESGQLIATASQTAQLRVRPTG